MENRVPVNRVERDLQQWRAQEESAGGLFEKLSSNDAFKREKLRYYEDIAAKYKDTNDLNEQFELKLLLGQRRDLERQIHPKDFISRILHRLLVVPIRKSLVYSHNVKQIENNSRSLQEQLKRIGVSGISEALDENIRKAGGRFSISLSYYHSQKERLDHTFNFVKDHAGNYQLDGFDLALHDELKPGNSRTHYFSFTSGYPVNSKEAYNLLSGRCIEKNGKWIQLDLSDSNKDGSFRTKEFNASYGYDLERLIQDLPLNELRNSNSANELYASLKQGNRQLVTFIKGGKEQKYYIEANPQFKSFHIYDEHSRKVSLNTTLGNKTVDLTKKVVKVDVKLNKTLSKRNGMKVQN